MKKHDRGEVPASESRPLCRQEPSLARSDDSKFQKCYPHLDALKDATAGAIAGAVAKTVVAPVERIKLLLQLQGSISHSLHPHNDTTALGAAGDKGRQGRPPYTSAWQAIRHVYHTQGALAFWRGNTPNVMQQAGNAALNFMLMDRYKLWTTPLLDYTMRIPSTRNEVARRKRRQIIGSFLSGGLAGGTATSVLYPVQFLRTRLGMDVGGAKDCPRRYPRGMRDVLSSVLRTDGVVGLYQGYGIAMAGVVIYRALHLGGYDALKTEIIHRKMQKRVIHPSACYLDNVKSQKMSEHLSMGERLAIAQCVSLIAGTMCYPIDSVRRRLMMQSGLLPNEQHLRKYRGSLDCFQKVWAEEGLRGFYLGLGPNMVRSIGGAVLLVGYDVFKGMIY